MTVKEIQFLVERHKLTSLSKSDVEIITSIMNDYVSRMEKQKLTREEEIVFWMYVKKCSFEEVDRWRAIVHGKLKLGQRSDGNIID